MSSNIARIQLHPFDKDRNKLSLIKRSLHCLRIMRVDHAALVLYTFSRSCLCSGNIIHNDVETQSHLATGTPENVEIHADA